MSSSHPLRFIVYYLSGLTLPIATLLYHGYDWNFYLMETCVFLVEGMAVFLFWKTPFRRSIAIAFAANAVSAGAGKLLELVIWRF